MTTFSELIDTPSASLCETSRQAAQARQKILTKPLGALSRMEDIAIDLAELQGRTCPQIKTVAISVFAADHGIAANGVSAYPQAVTAQMVSNFAHGGAAVAVMANRLGAKFEVVTLGTVGDVAPHERVVERTIAPSTDDFSKGYAMTPEQLERAMCVGAERVDALEQCDLFIAGEMGIGNTSSASALAAALLNINVADITGPGTGLDHTGVSKKAAILTAAVSHHTQDDPGALTLLMRLGGFEIVAMVGAYIRAAQRGIPILVDGVISSVAALYAVRLRPCTRDWMMFAHLSPEPAHKALLAALDAMPLLHMGMRLGEGSGAAIAVDLLRSACELHANMATFEDAGVDNKA